ncbi:ATP-binding cassette domain-containing protein [Streptomyces palmae]|uniref:ABC-F family ATP-binding cassette domain-containing protein n=1 Tax=Streptomyces palmae TaxID=1701085 RepID=A0A4Z0HDB9_9ACTN|nr:ATP-binding cassette domain-containing protein [Streptomyces palmae]TGB15568.1 ABC-F family ATP-binding cassette domain-containing protein [Streptomyces palmae]
MPTQITALAVSKSFNGRLVPDSVTCSLAAGERTGVTGENGSGKTTLLRLLAGRERPDQGEVVVQATGGVGYLAQDEQLTSQATVQRVIDRGLSDLRAVEQRMRRLETAMADGDEAGMAEYGELMTVFELRGGYDADARVERALHGLGLGLVGRDRTVGSLSGGERARLRLAACLAAAPEVLLLDEPTNHLDDAALSWLEEHLRARRGTTVAVSHDRVFLERVATSLLEVDADTRRVMRYGNGYTGYLAEKTAARQRWAQAHDQWRADIDRLREAAVTTVETELAAFARGRTGEAAGHAAQLLSLGLFDRDQLAVPVGQLSTGQLQRLALARLLSAPSDVLLLDEPTNHLSPALAEELETALTGYNGTLVIVSHDRRLRRHWRGAHLALQAAETSAATC